MGFGHCVIVEFAEKEAIMICPKCSKEGIETGDLFCRHCGLSLATPGSVTATDSDPGKGLQLFGAAIIIIVALFAFAVAPLMGWLNFVASALPWFSGALTLVGFAMILIGFGLSHAH
jgi:hypothetical protein